MSRSALTARLPALAILLLTGAVGIYFAAGAGGASAALLAAVAVACAVALVFRVEAAALDTPSVERTFDAGLLILPGLVTVYLAFNTGGYFPGEPALVAILLLLLLILRVTLVSVPFAGFGWPLGIAIGSLSLYSLWILLSATWSDSPARALIEFDRALVYLLVLLLFGSIPRASDRLRWMVRGLALAIVAIATVSLATRTLPDAFPTARTFLDHQLHYPLTYSNALGLLAVLGGLLCLHVASSLREPLAARALASAALPLLAATVSLTESRGAVAAGMLGVAAYAALGRPRGLVTAAIAAVPTTTVALWQANEAELLTSRDPTTAAAVAQGHDLALVLALCALAALVLRLALVPLDGWLTRFSLSDRIRRPATAAAWACAVSATLVFALAAGAPGWVSDNYDRFVAAPAGRANEEGDSRLSDPTSTAHLEYWEAALNGFEADPLRGEGAGVYETLWSRERPPSFGSDWASDAHSLYVEVLGELGLVGLILLAVALVAILAALAPFGKGANRSLYAVLFAAALAWAVHAGADWDWEMPAVSVWLFAVGGAALATSARERVTHAPPERTRVVVGVLLLAATVAPGLVLASQQRLDETFDAFNRRECNETIERAGATISTLAIRPEPYEAIAYCQVRRGNNRLAVEAMEEAVERDPQNWKYRYGLALVRGAAGSNPLPAAREAKRLNPQSHLTRQLVLVLGRGTPGERRRLAARLARLERVLASVP